MKLIRTYADKTLNDELTLAKYAEYRLLSFVYLDVGMDFDPKQDITVIPTSLFNTYSHITIGEYLDLYCVYPLTKKDNETITVIST